MKKKDKVKLNDYTRKQVMASDFPQIYIIEMKERPNGDCDVIFDTNKAKRKRVVSELPKRV